MIKSNAFMKIMARFIGTIGAILFSKFLGMTINIGFIIFVLILIVILFRKDFKEEINN